MTEVASSIIRRLPFSFANRFKLVLEWDLDFTSAMVYYVAPVSMTALAEVKRVVRSNLNLIELTASEFESKLTQVYQRDSSEVKETVRIASSESEWVIVS